jgi:hypothetical protein
MTVQQLEKGPVTIRYDLDRAAGERVAPDNILYEGVPLITAFVSRWHATPPSARESLRPFLFSLYDAVFALEGATPRNSLVSRDAADRVHEATVSTIWNGLLESNQNSGAMEYCIWILNGCAEWEGAIGSSPRYIHKGGPYFFGGIAALRCRNIDVAAMLFESGDLSDSQTYERAGVSEAGVNFPGRRFLTLDPHPANLLAGDVRAMREVVKGWLVDFARESGLPAAERLDIGDVDRLLFRDQKLSTESRYAIGHILRTNLIEREPVLGRVKGSGPLSRRLQAESALGLLTATEGILRRASGLTSSREFPASTVVATLASTWAGGSLGTPKDVRRVLGDIEAAHETSLDDYLTYWATWSPTGTTTGYPWFLRWLEPGRVVRNGTAHILEAPQTLDLRWNEVERVARYALLSALWLLRRGNKTT